MRVEHPGAFLVSWDGPVHRTPQATRHAAISAAMQCLDPMTLALRTEYAPQIAIFTDLQSGFQASRTKLGISEDRGQGRLVIATTTTTIITTINTVINIMNIFTTTIKGIFLFLAALLLLSKADVPILSVYRASHPGGKLKLRWACGCSAQQACV